MNMNTHQKKEANSVWGRKENILNKSEVFLNNNNFYCKIGSNENLTCAFFQPGLYVKRQQPKGFQLIFIILLQLIHVNDKKIII